jgi:UDP-N-acetylmuramoylalanine--D-glutamate ligase
MPTAYVIGLGKSGVAAARLLKRDGWDVVISDRGFGESLERQQQALGTEGITVQLGHSFDPDAFQLTGDAPKKIIVSPGVPWDLPALVRARALGIETLGEMELAWQHLRGCPWIGITGTNGKTTTTALIAAIFQAAGYHAPALGNIGTAACEVVLQEKSLDWAIAEISSYQIESSVTLAPHIGIWTTFTPDHLARHKTLENYYAIKAQLLGQSRFQVCNGDDAYLRTIGQQMGTPMRSDTCWTSVQGKAHLLGDPDRGAYIEDGWVTVQGKLILPVSLLRMPGAHNLQNLLMAVAAAAIAGIDKAAIAQAIATFPGVPHRLEHICAWKGIDFINDSKATNYDAAIVGLSAVAAPVILIAGGEAKIGDHQEWMEAIRQKAAAVLLIGNAAVWFASQLQAMGYENYEIVETMDRAVARSTVLAQQYQATSVLLSPACASFDQYQNFEQRGDHFRQLCLASFA